MNTFKVERFGVLLKTSFQVGVATEFKIEITPDVLPLALKRVVTATEYLGGFVKDLRLQIGEFATRWADASDLNTSFNPHRLVAIHGPIIVTDSYTGLVADIQRSYDEMGSPSYNFGIVVYGSSTQAWEPR